MKNYQLKGSKTGRIGRNEINKDLLTSVTLALGVVLCSTNLIYKTYKVKEKDAQISTAISSTTRDSFFSERIEKELSINMDDKYEDDINKLCSYLYMISQYDSIGSFIERDSNKTELVDSYRDIFDTSLNLLKNKVSDEKGIPVENIFIYVGGGKTIAEIYEDGNLVDSFNLKGDQLQLANSIAFFQTDNLEFYKEDDKLFRSYMYNMKNVIIDSVKLVDQVDDYRLPDFIKFVR